MKNIALFCDGTWQSLGQPFPTNVSRLARCVAAREAQSSIPQIVYYDEGVGVGEGVVNGIVRLIGGATGAGLDDKIIHAYRFICLNYEPGDRIFIFGFSRGAYTARSLSGMLRKLWILRRDQLDYVDDALNLYRNAYLDQQVTDKFKGDHCHVGAPMLAQRAPDPSRVMAAAADQNASSVRFVGVWDTVGSLGIPSTLPFASLIDKRYQFHDLSLSRFVLSARHAVSIDERRATFQPTLWNNIEGLNTNANAAALPFAERPYQQSWFPGRHSGVGGGQNDGGLSISPLLWIAEGATRAGLAFDDKLLQEIGKNAKPTAPFVPEALSLSALMLRFVGQADRCGPTDFDEVSAPARTRWRDCVPNYRPGPLSRFKDRLG